MVFLEELQKTSKICAIAVGIKDYMPMIKTKKKKHGKIVLLAESKLNNIEVLISNALINEFVVINNVLKEYDKMKEKNQRLESVYKKTLSYSLKCRKNTESKNPQVLNAKNRKNNAFIKMWSVW